MKLNLDFYSGKDFYSDGDIENDILNIVKNNTDFSRVFANDHRWPILYHLSPLRRNLLEWYNFKGNARLLEIGAGCGALTGLFCEKVKEVVAVELSRKRAEVISTWHKDRSNLEIVVGNAEDIPFDENFDYITLIGVLEYGGKFTHTDNPYYDFLKRIKGYLRPGGTLILAIENKFGLKYWAGAKENHSGRYFEGIENYLNDISVRTFGKSELEDLLKTAGFKDIYFHYPLPDYKLPQQIFSDDFLPDIGQIEGVSPNYDNDRIVFFNEARAYDNIIINRQFPFFANSFLLFCYDSDKATEIIYSKFNRERRPAFQIETSIYKQDDKLKVLKKALTREAKKHIEAIYDNYRFLENFCQDMDIARAQLADRKIVFEFVPGKSLDRLLIDAVFKSNTSEFYLLLDGYVRLIGGLLVPVYDDLEDQEYSYRIFGNFKGMDSAGSMGCAIIDLNFDNIILNKNNKFEIFDYEWIFQFKIPINFIIFRNVEAFFGKYSEYIKEFINIKEVLDRYKITRAEVKVYKKVEKAFQIYVMGKNRDYQIKKGYKRSKIIFDKRNNKLSNIFTRFKLSFGK